jgi:UDP-N-acetylglucosamine 2-epimerase (non-hydrolysing)
MRNLLAEGIHPRFIQKTGSPIREIYEYYKDKIQDSTIVEDLSLIPQGYFLVSLHRQENVDSPERLATALNSIEAVREKFGLPILVSTHPRTRKRLEELGRVSLGDTVFHEPFGYLDYNRLQRDARCVISDSGTISEESSILGFPAVTLRDSMERPEALETGSVLLCGVNSDLVAIVSTAIGSHREQRLPEGYEVDDFSNRVLGFLLSTASMSRRWRAIHNP